MSDPPETPRRSLQDLARFLALPPGLLTAAPAYPYVPAPPNRWHWLTADEYRRAVRLLAKMRYGGRKGRSAARRLRALYRVRARRQASS